SPIGMKRNLGKVAIALLFISAAITCSLTTWATSPGYGTAPGIGKTSPTGTMPNLTRDNPANPLLGECVGEPRVTLTSPFASDYTCTNLGSLPVPFPWGALTLKYDDPNTLLIGGNANSPMAASIQIAVTRDANNHITGFSGGATVYPAPNSTIGQYNDGVVVFG